MAVLVELYEVNQRVVGGSWVNVLFTECFHCRTQSRFAYSFWGNFLMGFELHERIQLTSGLNIDFSISSSIRIYDRCSNDCCCWLDSGNQWKSVFPFIVILIPDVRKMERLCHNWCGLVILCGLPLFLYSISVALASDSIPPLYHVVQTGLVTGYVYSENDKDVFARSRIFYRNGKYTHLLFPRLLYECCCLEIFH